MGGEPGHKFNYSPTPAFGMKFAQCYFIPPVEPPTAFHSHWRGKYYSSL